MAAGAGADREVDHLRGEDEGRDQAGHRCGAVVELAPGAAQGQRDAARGQLSFTSPEGKAYAVADPSRTPVVLPRPRGWHFDEAHLTADGRPVVAALVDFGLHFFHNARELLAGGSGPYYYLPKLESHLEARLWDDVFTHAEAALGVPHGSVRATASTTSSTSARTSSYDSSGYHHMLYSTEQ